MMATSAPLRRRDSVATMRSGPCGSTTASSSITVREVAAARRRRSACPCSSITSNGRPARSSAVTIDAHASTARSNDARSCAPGRTSSINSTGVRRRALVLAHHQVSAARRRPPVHVAQVVAGRVLAQRHELAARFDSRAAPAGGRGRGRVRRRRAAATMSCTRGYTITCSVPRARAASARTSPNGIGERRRATARPRSGPRRSVGKRYAARASSPGSSGASRKRAARRPRSNASVTASVGCRLRSPARRRRRGPRTPTWSRSFSSRRAIERAARRNRTHTYAPTSRQRGDDGEHRELHEAEEAPADEQPGRGADERPIRGG